MRKGEQLGFELSKLAFHDRVVFYADCLMGNFHKIQHEPLKLQYPLKKLETFPSSRNISETKPASTSEVIASSTRLRKTSESSTVLSSKT
ncbi:hypothetical protein COMA2_10037 [Candidatus Nitrospira nitrificans]|uniref:Uncharacterized protein n=1 Tax=Candidatus Nitrospira nitrificans TaxID=1742973 RepID=A0A0S4L136_9BACT|nr:hypothetical protein COMA2_10037 [Candidatus Nitrospira nitrificans]